MQHWVDKQPIEGLPAGLLSWFAPGDMPVVLVTHWVALIGGKSPRLRASWPGRRDPRSLFWPGGDFILHLLSEENLRELGRLAGAGRLCFDAEGDLGLVASPAAVVKAPLFRQFPAQLECCHGKIEGAAAEPEVAGEVLWVHTGAGEIDVGGGMDLETLGLLHCFSGQADPEK